MVQDHDPFVGSAGARARKAPQFGVAREAYWAAMVPREVAARQVMWEREVFVLRARAAGLTLEKIGKLLGGVCKEQVRHLEAKHTRCYVLYPRPRFSPVEEWYAKKDDVEALAALIRAQRRRAIRFRQEGKPYRPLPHNSHKPILSD